VFALSVLALAPGAALAQEDATAASGTDVHLLIPFGPEGLHPDLTEAARVTGACSEEALASPGRPDAWECLGEDDQIYDPCFENPYRDVNAPAELACFDSPFSSDVVVVETEEPLARVMELASDSAIDPRDIPWALELTNAERCVLQFDIDVILAGEAVHYACSEGGLVLGEVNRGRQVWTVTYLANGALETTLAGVAAAWY
jgi:hypothetical protein